MPHLIPDFHSAVAAAVMIVEAIAAEKSRPTLDPVELAAAAGIALDPWQVRCLYDQSPQVLMNCSRQVGKSTVDSIDAVCTAMSESNSLVLLLAPSLRQSTELFRKCLDVYKALDLRIPAFAESALRLELKNGSRIIALPATDATVRGYSSAKLLVIDEASRVDDSLYRSVRPMLAVSRGRLRASSTPFGKRGWWFEAWEHGGLAWSRYLVPATECPRLTPEFLAEERTEMPPWYFNQEYMCEFSDTDEQFFAYEAVMQSLSEVVVPLFGAFPSTASEPLAPAIHRATLEQNTA